MSKENKNAVVVSNNSQSLVEATLPDLMTMISQSIENQTKINPIYQKIHDKILGIFQKEDELDNMEVKDLIKLLELTSKAQLTPVEQLTKLVQAATALYERAEVESKSKTLDAIIDKFDNLHNAPWNTVEYSTKDAVDGEVDELQEDDTMKDLNDIMNE